MEEETPKTRSQEHEIEIAAPIEAVWKAITDAEELTRWFVDHAKVTPGVGGTCWVAWGEGESQQAYAKKIEVWEPPHRLRLGPQGPEESDTGPSPEAQATAALAVPIVDEYILEARGGRTLLRVVSSGIPASAEWDGFYDSTNYGWKLFFRTLRHYLERHPGKPRNTVITLQQPISIDAADAWKKFIGPEGLAAEGSFEGLKDGDRFQVTTSAGESLTGEVGIIKPPKIILLAIDTFNGAVLSAAFEQMGGANFLYITLATYGSADERASGLGERWSQWLKGLFQVQ
jgi:uncharacterized protein YndB with AHSA1/START domain